MEEATVPVAGSNVPAPRPSVRKPRPSVMRSSRPAVSSDVPTNIHMYAPWALVAAVIILALAVLGVIAIPGQKSEAWQAVFLTNGQAYFGHVVRVTPNWLVLRDVHYIQTAPSGAAGPQAPTSMSLVKLGSEIHGPMNEMRINREHVLLTEVLRNDSAVVQTIDAAREAAEQPDAGASVEAPEDAAATNVAPPSPSE